MESSVENIKRTREQGGRVNKGGHYTWNSHEDVALVQALHTLSEDSRWKAENGIFRLGYLIQLEKMIENDLPNSYIKVETHIESIVRLVKRQYNAISDMLTLGSGFSWNDIEKCVTAPKDVYADWVRSHLSTKGLRNKPFSFYYNFVTIFGKDRANGQGAEIAVDAVERQDKEDNEDDNVSGLFNSKTDDVSVHFIPDGQYDTSQTDTDAEVDVTTSTIHPNIGKGTHGTEKKKAKTAYGNNPLDHHVLRFQTAYEKTTEHIAGIASFFIKEMEASDKRQSLFNELKKLDGFSRKEMLIAGEYMVRNAYKIDYFFSLPTDFKHEYIKMVLTECNVYRPSFPVKKL
ncbi:hypothetical protein PTKIN_Ptkin17bG0019800 [Pterospermum kingtungense]